MSLFSPLNPQQTLPVSIPAALLSSYNFENAQFGLVDSHSGPAYAACSKTPEQIFNGYSTALSAPGATYYVNAGTGNDANAGTSSAPFASVVKGVTAANAANVPTKLIITPGIYPRIGANVIAPTVDIAFVAAPGASIGRVVIGTFDLFTAPSKDATYTNTYSFARSNCDRVYDLLNVDRFGCYVQLTLAATAAICNATPGTWYTDNTTVYINRADSAAVTNANTRYVLHAQSIFTNPNNKNLYFGDGLGGATNCGFDTEGGFVGGYPSIVTSVSSTRCIQVFSNCRFRYGGGRNTFTQTGAGRGFSVDSHYGAAWLFNCDASCNATDGFNHHNSLSSPFAGLVTINCTGNNNGITPNQSNNGWTSHETCVGADFAGAYENNRGGSCRSINSTLSFLAATYVKNDLGDTMFGGAELPTAFQTDNSAVYYCFRTKADMPGGTIAYLSNAASTSQILQRQCWPSRGSTGGAGVIGSY